MDVYRLCGEFGWPVLIHMDYTGAFGTNFPPSKASFAPCPTSRSSDTPWAWWTNVSADAVTDPSSPDFSDYPMGPVRRVGISDRLLTEYSQPLRRPLRPVRLPRSPQGRPASPVTSSSATGTKLLWGTDCPCHDGRGNYPNGTFRVCLGEVMLSLLRDSCESEAHFDDITHNNGARLLGLETI